MRFIEEFRDTEVAARLLAAIKREASPERHYRLMEFCGGHTHAIFRFGLQTLLPPAVQLVHGPGCPVCVLPVWRIEQAIHLAAQPDVILCSFGDMLRVPGVKGSSLLAAQARGASVQMVWSPTDALSVARQQPNKKVVFFAIGFETTTPTTAAALMQAQSEGLTNFLIFNNHLLTPAAISAILGANDVALDGLIGPAHVSAIIGSNPYLPFVGPEGKPLVIAGFEPLDILQAVLLLIRQINRGEAKVENEYSRVVTPQGNIKAQQLVERYFCLRPANEWRGLGEIPQSGLMVRPEFADFDAEAQFALPNCRQIENPGCLCGAILRGVASPPDCPLFGRGCTPQRPIGPCMVSSEGSCSAWHLAVAG